ncbi:uncharacterized protein PAN0_001d0539 [Moesziomyces antarcticus]|uniref:Uncharacterized protein n=1 Tax=Pseudozyma antarctica TaxID=84753 RepID=A0A5C3FER0_PSEA2|nr:uncharacterized protein PAN0_001d0539 [Moesziomyces antarcticus]GAK62339.1 hypothetical protein PAN0_001d0539 [Moesziomyces antarcticus]SPO42883.1 uncharacterized protein PSANT_00567 [Moesziomyces antarcticus]
MAAPWTWRLDPSSGSASVLGPSPSSIAVSADPLSALAHSTDAASADDIVWHDFRPPPRPTAARQARKRARLNRFDSDDDEDLDQTLRTVPSTHNHAGAVPGPLAELDAKEAREDEDAGMASTSSSDSESNDEDTPLPRPGSSQACLLQGETRKPDTSSQRAPKPTRTSSEDAFAQSTRLMAHTIYTYSLADAKRAEKTDAPSPLTYKETVRLVRLIAMIFRFPKPSRRVSRQHTDSVDIASPPPSSSSGSTPTLAVKDESDDETIKIELKPKYLASASGGGSRRPRMLARVHPEDTRMDSAAVLKLLALVPSALPARVEDAAWIAGLAVRARRDEYGNILLPHAAYAPAQPADTHTGSTNSKEENEGPQKVTRSLVHKLGREPPAIPLPQFWRRRSPSASMQELDCEEENAAERSLLQAEVEVEALTAIATPQQDALTTEKRGRSVVNLSRVLADRMREKRQAKTLLLRTHPTLRKRRTAQPPSEAVQHAENEADALTAANTAANALSGAHLPLPDHVD